MWEVISYVIIALELVLIGSFVVGKLRKKKVNESLPFLALVALVSLALYIVPYLHSVLVLGAEKNHIFALLDCISKAVKLFLGSVDTEAVADFTLAVPVFTAAYLLGALLALSATVSAAVEAFGHRIANAIRLNKAMNKPGLDVVFGDPDAAERYAGGNENVVILLENGKKETAVSLMEAGHTVLRKKFSVELLQGRCFKTGIHYNLICLGQDEAALRRLDTFIAFKKADAANKDISFYLELEDAKAATVQRDIIDKSGLGASITTFCSRELLACSFTRKHPITEHMPQAFIDRAAIKPEKTVQMFFLGFGQLSRELYRQSVLNNQLVSFERGEYRLKPVQYHIYDTEVREEAWNIGGLQAALAALPEAEFFPLPELPYVTHVQQKDSVLRANLDEVAAAVRKPDTFSCLVVDAGDDFANMQTGARLRALLAGADNFHIFVRSTASYTENDALTTYYGSFDAILCHDVIVNDSLSSMARKVNEIYTGDAAKAAENWAKMDHFTLRSNLYAAMNLQLKLNLLGLRYEKGAAGEDLIAQRLRHRGQYAYEEYFEESCRNALLAQEHARWNAYHLLHEWLPMEKAAVVLTERTAERVRFRTKDSQALRHACLTTFRGLDELSSCLARQAGGNHKPEEFDYYIYDEMLITTAYELLSKLGYKVTEK